MLSIIIVNWNTRLLLQRCLQTILAYVPEQLLAEIIVVDNGSSDGSQELILKDYPEVRLIANSDNLGFAAANNKGIALAKGKYLLLLNTDTILIPGTLEMMLRFMEDKPRAGLCTPALLREDGSLQNTFGPYPSLLTEIFGWYPRMKMSVGLPRQVPAIRGACMLARREIMNSVANFDERYFLFLEETDLCYRLNKQGYEVWWLPEAKVYHLGGASAKEQPTAARIEYWRSRYLFFRVNYRLPRYLGLRFGLELKLIIDWFLHLAAGAVTLFAYQPFLIRLKRYTRLLLWHLSGCPGTWGLDSGNTVKINQWEIRKEYLSWWQENKDKITAETGSWELVKDNASRKVFIYRSEFYIKRYKKNFLGGLPSWRKEWRILVRLRQLGIAAPVPVAAGPGYLVTKKIKDVMTLHDYILNNAGSLSWLKKKNLCTQLAGFISLLHRKGLYHGDLHAGNILIDVKDNKLFITDLHRAGLKMQLSPREMINNLVQFNMFFSLQSTACWRRRFFREYIRQTPFSLEESRYLWLIEQKTKDACSRLWRKRDKIYLRKAKYGLKKRKDKFVWIVNPAAAGYDWQQLLSRPGNVIKDSRSSYIRISQLAADKMVVVKQSRQKRRLNYFKDLFRYSRAFRAYAAAWALLVRGIRTAKPQAAADLRAGAILKQSFFISEYISSSKNLKVWLRDRWSSLTGGEQREFLGNLARFVRTIHDRGVFPRDLKGSNILVQELADKRFFYLIDLDHLATKKVISRQQRLYNLHQLVKSFSGQERSAVDCIRTYFLYCYFYPAGRNKLEDYAKRV